jgi:hypothetical protein
MAEYDVRIKITVPWWVEWMVVWPLLVYRKVKYGYVFRRIRLTRGLWAIVDPIWYERLKEYKWHAKGGHGECYAARGYRRGGRTAVEWMHKVILRVPRGFVVDHINGNTLDNRRANLRIATLAQNAMNSSRRGKAGSSKYKGVSWDGRAKKWRAMIHVHGRPMYLGGFDDEVEAAKAYDGAARIYQREFAVLNFPDSGKLRTAYGVQRTAERTE